MTFIHYYTDLDDFDNATQSVVFNATDKTVCTEMVVNIPIFDDGIDEPDEEVFIVHLLLHTAVNRELIVIEQDTSSCIIFDSGQGNAKDSVKCTILIV